MAAVTGSAPLWMRAGLIDKAVELYNRKMQYDWKRFMDEITTKDRYYQLAQVGDMPAAAQVDELAAIPDLTFQTPGAQQIVPLGYKGVYRLSDEAYRRDPEGLYKQRVPKFLAASHQKAMDIVGAGFLSSATSSSFLTTWDSLAIASASHITSGSTFTNIVTISGIANPVLTYSAVMNALLQLYAQPSYINEPMQYEGSCKLLVPIALQAVASNIKEALDGGRYDVNTHEKSWVGPRISDIVVVRRSTSTTAWMLVLDSADENPFKMINGLKPTVRDWYDGNYDAWAWNTTGMFAPACEKPQGFVYSSGAGS